MAPFTAQPCWGWGVVVVGVTGKQTLTFKLLNTFQFVLSASSLQLKMWARAFLFLAPSPGSGRSLEWMCITHMSTAMSRTPMPQIHGNGKAFSDANMDVYKWLTSSQSHRMQKPSTAVSSPMDDCSLGLFSFRDHPPRLASPPFPSSWCRQ